MEWHPTEIQRGTHQNNIQQQNASSKNITSYLIASSSDE